MNERSAGTGYRPAEIPCTDVSLLIAYEGGRRDGLVDAIKAVKTCPSLDENGYICEKSEAIKAIGKLQP